MRKRTRKLIWAMLTALCWSGLHAQTVLISSAAVFTGTATMVDFNTLLNETAITNQYAGQGVIFGGGLLSMTNSGDIAQFPSNGGGVIASDWRYSGGPGIGLQTLPWTATFAGIETRAGFLLEAASGSTTQLTTFLNGTPTGTVSLVSVGTTAVFFGAQNLSGFNSISVNITGPNQFLGMDDFRFEAVPEPGAAVLLASGLLVLGLHGCCRRGKSTNKPAP